MEGMTFSIKSMSTHDCKNYVQGDYRFCPICGSALTHEMIYGSFQDQLKKEITLPRLIYNKPTGNEFCEFKLSQLLDKSGDYLMTNAIDIRYMKLDQCRSYLTIDKGTRGIHTKYLPMLDKYFADPSKISSETSVETRLNTKNAVLAKMGINHTFSRLTDPLVETVQDLLIMLIENEISDPICGDRFVLVPDQDIKYNKQYNMDYWDNPENYNRDANKTVRYTMINHADMPFDEKEKKRGLEKLYKGLDDSEAKLKKYETMQTEVDNVLSKLPQNIYYSSRTRKMYLKDELQKLLSKEIYLLKFVLDDHCIPLSIRQINVWVLGEEIEELFYFKDMKKRLTVISDAFGGDMRGVSMLMGLLE
jgi:hypothetical protein